MKLFVYGVYLSKFMVYFFVFCVLCRLYKIQYQIHIVFMFFAYYIIYILGFRTTLWKFVFSFIFFCFLVKKFVISIVPKEGFIINFHTLDCKGCDCERNYVIISIITIEISFFLFATKTILVRCCVMLMLCVLNLGRKIKINKIITSVFGIILKRIFTIKDIVMWLFLLLMEDCWLLLCE